MVYDVIDLTRWSEIIVALYLQIAIIFALIPFWHLRFVNARSLKLCNYLASFERTGGKNCLSNVSLADCEIASDFSFHLSTVPQKLRRLNSAVGSLYHFARTILHTTT